MKKAYDSPTMEIAACHVLEPFSASSTQPDVEYDDLTNWSPLVPPKN